MRLANSVVWPFRESVPRAAMCSERALLLLGTHGARNAPAFRAQCAGRGRGKAYAAYPALLYNPDDDASLEWPSLWLSALVHREASEAHRRADFSSGFRAFLFAALTCSEGHVFGFGGDRQGLVREQENAAFLQLAFF